jgi:hypothetical protein
MKHYIYLIAFVAFIAAGCSKNNPVAPTDAANHGNDPMSAATGSTSDAIFDIPAPIMGTVTNSTIATVGGTGSITVCWSYQTPANTYYTATLYKPQGNKPNRPFGFVPTGLNPTAGVILTPALNSPYEFWGGSQKSIVSTPSYTGHYDVERSTDGGATWTEITETRAKCITDNNGGAGWHVGDVVSYRIKEKSNEKKSGTQANDATHHSDYSGTGTITVCGPVTGPDQFDNHCAVSAAGGNGTWSECTWTSNTCKNALNLNFNILQHHTIRNTCTDAITQDGDSYNYTGNMCASIDGGNTWVSATWNTDHYEVSLANAGTGNYTVNYSTDCTPSGAISATTSVVVPDCGITGEGCIHDAPENNIYSIVGGDGNYDGSKGEGNVVWLSAHSMNVPSTPGWNAHFHLWDNNTCDNTNTEVTCGANSPHLYFCLSSVDGSDIFDTGDAKCTGQHYNIDGNNIPNPQAGTSFRLTISDHQDCVTGFVWTVTYTVQ